MLQAKTPIQPHDELIEEITDRIFSNVPLEDRASVLRTIIERIRLNTVNRLKTMEEEAVSIHKNAEKIALQWEGL